MATTGWVAEDGARASVHLADAHPRVRILLLVAAGVAAAGFVTLTVLYLLDPQVVAGQGFAVAWWTTCLAAPVLAVAACVAGSDDEDDHGYLGTCVEGLRSEWGTRRH